jgi:hypothetical protein
VQPCRDACRNAERARGGASVSNAGRPVCWYTACVICQLRRALWSVRAGGEAALAAPCVARALLGPVATLPPSVEAARRGRATPVRRPWPCSCRSWPPLHPPEEAPSTGGASYPGVCPDSCFLRARALALSRSDSTGRAARMSSTMRSGLACRSLSATVQWSAWPAPFGRLARAVEASHCALVSHHNLRNDFTFCHIVALE